MANPDTKCDALFLKIEAKKLKFYAKMPESCWNGLKKAMDLQAGKMASISYEGFIYFSLTLKKCFLSKTGFSEAAHVVTMRWFVTCYGEWVKPKFTGLDYFFAFLFAAAAIGTAFSIFYHFVIMNPDKRQQQVPQLKGVATPAGVSGVTSAQAATAAANTKGAGAPKAGAAPMTGTGTATNVVRAAGT